MNNSLAKTIPGVIIVVLVICMFLGHSVKKKAFDNAVDENLIKSLMVGSATKVDKDNFGWLVCTDENIKSVNITRKSVHLGIFEKSVLVDFDISINSNGKMVSTQGYLNLIYDKKKKTKWKVYKRILRNENVSIYE